MPTATPSPSRPSTSSALLVPSAEALQRLRRENAMLTSEKRFLTQAVAAGPSTSARVNSIRYNADAVELKMLQAYLIARELRDAEGCRAVEAQMERRVAETRAKVELLRQLLDTVRKDVEEVLEASAGWDAQGTA